MNSANKIQQQIPGSESSNTMSKRISKINDLVVDDLKDLMCAQWQDVLKNWDDEPEDLFDLESGWKTNSN